MRQDHSTVRVAGVRIDPGSYGVVQDRSVREVVVEPRGSAPEDERSRLERDVRARAIEAVRSAPGWSLQAGQFDPRLSRGRVPSPTRGEWPLKPWTLRPPPGCHALQLLDVAAWISWLGRSAHITHRRLVGLAVFRFAIEPELFAMVEADIERDRRRHPSVSVLELPDEQPNPSREPSASSREP